jgi:hypothetical protein
MKFSSPLPTGGSVPVPARVFFVPAAPPRAAVGIRSGSEIPRGGVS